MTDYEVLQGVNLQSPLRDLIDNRMQELGLAPETLGFRLNYQNPVKGAGRVQALCDGHLNNRKSRAALARLPIAVEVPEETVQQAVEATKQIIAELRCQAEERQRLAWQEADARWRASFQPHAVIDTEDKCPSQIVMCAMTGGMGRLIIRLDSEQPPVTFVQQAIEVIQYKLSIGRTGRRYVPFFGAVLGLIINYTPDHAVRFNMDGEPLELLPTAYRLGEIQLSVG